MGGGAVPVATLTSTSRGADERFDWGAITWLCSGRIDPAARMTFGVVQIEPERSNPRHYHPNCEEYIFLLEGACEHSLGAEVFHLQAGDLLRIPQGVPHHAVNRGPGPVRMVIAYSAPDRQTVGEGFDPSPKA